MKKSLGSVIVIIGLILLTFFGLGPVMFADGSMGERIGTLGVVLVIYTVLIVLFRYIRKTW